MSWLTSAILPRPHHGPWRSSRVFWLSRRAAAPTRRCVATKDDGWADDPRPNANLVKESTGWVSPAAVKAPSPTIIRPELTLEERQLAKILKSDFFEPPQRTTSRLQAHLAQAPGPSVHARDDLILSSSIEKSKSLGCREALVALKTESHGERSFLTSSPIFLIAEGKEHVCWNQLKKLVAQHPSTRDPQSLKDGADRVAWVGRLHGSLVRAHMKRAVDGNADHALRTIIRLHDLRSEYPAARSISDGPGTGNLRLNLLVAEAGSLAATSVELFEQFLSVWQSRASRGTGKWEFMHPQVRASIAWTWLAHPRAPDPEPSIRLFRELQQGKIPRPEHPKTLAEETFHFKFGEHLSYVLRKAGRLDEARWADNITAKYFTRRKRWEQGR